MWSFFPFFLDFQNHIFLSPFNKPTGKGTPTHTHTLRKRQQKRKLGRVREAILWLEQEGRSSLRVGHVGDDKGARVRICKQLGMDLGGIGVEVLVRPRLWHTHHLACECVCVCVCV